VVVAAIQKNIHSWCDHPVKGVVLFGDSMGRNHHGAKFSKHPCLCYTGCPANSVCTCSWASMQCSQNIIISTPLLLMFCTHSWEGASPPPSSMYILKCFVTWNSVKWISLPAFQHNSPTISIAQTVYKMHVGIFLICKC
jgi:hypothetical protein